MASNNTITLVGNILEPEVRSTQTGKTLVKARMVVKTYGDADDMWVNVTAWEKLGENLAQTFQSQTSKSIRIWLVIVDTVSSKTMKFKNRSHPRFITFC